MHIMHPFLDLEHVEYLFDDFTNQLAEQELEKNSYRLTVPTGANVSKPYDRQQSESDCLMGDNTTIEDYVAGTEDSLENGIVMLILALGSVCAEKASVSLPEVRVDPSETRFLSVAAPQGQRTPSQETFTPLWNGTTPISRQEYSFPREQSGITEDL